MKKQKTKKNKTKRGGTALSTLNSPIDLSLLNIDFSNLSNIIISYKGKKIADAEIIRYNQDTFIINMMDVENQYKGQKVGKFILKNLLAFIFSNKSINYIVLYDKTQSNQYNPNRGMGKIPNQMYLKSGFEYIGTNPYNANKMGLTRERYEQYTLHSNYLNRYLS